jgi:hypothetical protein
VLLCSWLKIISRPMPYTPYSCVPIHLPHQARMTQPLSRCTSYHLEAAPNSTQKSLPSLSSALGEFEGRRQHRIRLIALI